MTKIIFFEQMSKRSRPCSPPPPPSPGSNIERRFRSQAVELTFLESEIASMREREAKRDAEVEAIVAALKKERDAAVTDAQESLLRLSELETESASLLSSAAAKSREDMLRSNCSLLKEENDKLKVCKR